MFFANYSLLTYNSETDRILPSIDHSIFCSTILGAISLEGFIVCMVRRENCNLEVASVRLICLFLRDLINLSRKKSG